MHQTGHPGLIKTCSDSGPSLGDTQRHSARVTHLYGELRLHGSVVRRGGSTGRQREPHRPRHGQRNPRQLYRAQRLCQHH